MIVRAPQLFDCLRAFCLGSFRALLQELERGADLPFAFEEHSSYDRPALYEYRPLVKPFIESRAHTLRRRPDAELAVDELRREPAAAIFARAHAGPRADEHEALFGSVLLPLLISTAEMCGGFDWDDTAYERAYAELEAALFGEGHQYGAVAPLIGMTTGGATIELGANMRIRLAATGELAKLWPEANGLLPTDFGREADRLSILELERALEPGATEPPDAPGEFADAISAIRLATAAPIAAGPVLFERLDWRPYGVRPVVPIAATQPAGEPTRLDSFRAALAADLLPRLALADGDPDLGEARSRRNSSESRLPRCSAATTASGQPRSAAPSSSATRHEHAPSCRTVCRMSQMQTSFAARSSRRCCTATARSLSPRSMSRFSGCARDR